MTPKAIASLVSQMKLPQVLNADSVQKWRLEQATQLGAMSILSKTYKEFSNPFKRDW